MEIEKAVEATDAVIVCLSNNSVSKEGYIQRELRFVLGIADYKPEGTIFIIPIRLDDSLIPRRLRMFHHADFFPEEQREFTYKRILKSLEKCYETLFSEKANRKKDVREENVFAQFTLQELYVLMFVSEGMTNRDIANILFLKDGTVRNYVSSILSKLGVNNRAEAAAFAVEHNLRKYIQ
jgi:DNA-binding CsgD family transcriptional regulator